MAARLGYGLSVEQKAELWRRYRRGESCSEIGEISRGLSAQLSMRQIAARLGRAASSISREIRRHGGRGGYRALQADQGAWQRARRPKCGKLAQHRRLRATVIDGLKRDWSPKQIARRLPTLFPCDQSMRVSHETIYRSLFIQARGELKKELLAHLRTGRVMRRARTASMKGKGQGQIVGAVSIRERPAEAEDRDPLVIRRSDHIAAALARARYLTLAARAIIAATREILSSRRSTVDR